MSHHTRGAYLGPTLGYENTMPTGADSICVSQAENVQAAERALDQELPALRRLLRLPSLRYVHPANQGDGFLIETPAGRKDIPKVHLQMSCSTALTILC